MMMPATILALVASILTPLFFYFLTIGKDPGISITENRISVTDIISRKFGIIKEVD